jgi:hypothetical protein
MANRQHVSAGGFAYEQLNKNFFHEAIFQRTLCNSCAEKYADQQTMETQ